MACPWGVKCRLNDRACACALPYLWPKHEQLITALLIPMVVIYNVRCQAHGWTETEESAQQ